MISEKEFAFTQLKEFLKKFGLKERNIDLYVFLLQREKATKPIEFFKELGIHRTDTYRILKELEKMGLVNRILDKYHVYEAIPFSTVMRRLIEVKELEQKQQISSLRESTEQMEKLLSSYDFRPPSSPERFFNIITGMMVYTKARELAQENDKVYVCGSILDVHKLDYNNFFDSLKDECDLVLPENFSQQAKKYLKKGVNLKATKITDLPCFIIGSDEVILFFDRDAESRNNLYALCTGVPDIVKSYKVLFERLYS